MDTVTPKRDITHEHFAAGDDVVIIQGIADGELIGGELRIVAPSWHTPTEENGWRLRDPEGGALSYLTAHPRYLIHAQRKCPDCLMHLLVLHQRLVPQVPKDAVVDGNWYDVTDKGQIIHTADKERGQ